MKIVILDAGTLGADIDLSPFDGIGDVTVYETTATQDVPAAVTDADVIVVNKVKLNESNLAQARALKLICVAATGYDNIDTEYCTRTGVAVCNVPGYSTDSVAQLSAAMALSLACNLTAYRDYVHSGAYTGSGKANRVAPVYHELSSMTWGVVGGGGIGTKVAQIARALGCRVLVCRRKAEGEFPLADIDTLCRESDIISLHVPLTDETRALINAERIARMKKNVIIVNTARGAVTDEDAIARAVLEGRIGGFGCDVYSAEPFGKEHPFHAIRHLDNVCLTPHMAWGSYESRARCVNEMAENMRAFFAGECRNRVV